MKQSVRIVPKVPLSNWYQNNSSQSTEEQIVNVLINALDKESQSGFLNFSLKDIPDPSLLKGIGKGVEILLNHLRKQTKILIIGDFDVDGITSTVLLIRFFKTIAFTNYDSFIPNRFVHGYGLTNKAVDAVIEMKPDLVITVDNGVTAKNEVARLLGEGIEVIVTDHHESQEELLPDCTIINPKQPNCDYPCKDLSGVGVVFLLLVAARAELRRRGFWTEDRKEPNLLRFLDLVALGTIADQVPLLGLNRILTKAGLEQMTKRIHENSPGEFFFYLKVFAEKSKLNFIDSDTVAFRLGPMLNATGRMKDACEGVHFLLSDSWQNAVSRFQYVERLNQKRRKKQLAMVKKAFKQAKSLLVEEKGLLIYDDSFHQGLIGIIASRLVDQYGMPSIVMANGEQGCMKASCRSRNVSILEILQECRDYIEQYSYY